MMTPKQRRLTIQLPREIWEQLKDIACAERRYPKQQVEYMIIQAVQAWEAGVTSIVVQEVGEKEWYDY